VLTADEANRLFEAAFPWRATVEHPGEWAFVSLRYHALEDTSRGDTIEVRFERDPGDTVGRVSRGDLEHAVQSGSLAMEDRIVRQPEAADAVLLEEPFLDLIGWQSRSDLQWVARMRLHQSWWRTYRLRVPFGTGPNRGGKGHYGNMLDDRSPRAGSNFVCRSAADVYARRVNETPEGVDAWRTSRNLLASQPMAFNLFGPSIENQELATATFDRILGDVAAVTGGEVERLSDALDDHTAFDAFFTCRRADKSDGCIAIETKLTEPFSQQNYKWAR
jgi:hypothetical protein